VLPDEGEVERRARLIAGALGRMGLTAFEPGDRDLVLGPALLRRVLADAKVPTVSANLYDQKGARLFDADRLVDAAGVKVGIFGVIGPASADDAALWKTWGLEARDPAAAARAEVASLRARGAQIVVALVHVGLRDVSKKLLDEVPGIDWAVLGHSGLNIETPEPAGGARMLEAMTMGKHVGRLDLHVVDGDARQFVDRGHRAQVATILADHQRQIADFRTRAVEAPQPSMRQYFEGRVAELERAIARETAELRALPAEVKQSWFDNRIIPLDTATADHPAVAMQVAAYNAENARRAAAGKPVGFSGVSAHGTPAPAPGATPPDQIRFAGTVACGSCHQAALKLWQTTRHAHALDSLKKVKRDHDPTCVGCHVTGFLRPGGTTDLAVATGRLRDVGCEACHGPGVDHLTAADKRGSITRQVGESVCRGCHTADQTNGDFSYPAFVKAVLGPGHGGA
jgi:hypothetical protein